MNKRKVKSKHVIYKLLYCMNFNTFKKINTIKELLSSLTLPKRLVPHLAIYPMCNVGDFSIIETVSVSSFTCLPSNKKPIQTCYYVRYLIAGAKETLCLKN